MKLISFLIALLLFSCQMEGAVALTLANFNIKPVPGHNNTEGFIKLSKYLKGKSNININFLPGVYIVGSQRPSFKKVVENIDNIFVIEGCSNILINGNGAIIKFADSLMYGSFDITTKKPLTHQTPFFKGENAAYPGNCILISQSNNIRIQNLKLDGNGPATIIGGRYGDTGIQLWHRGVYIRNSYDVNLYNMTIHNFCLDGIEVSNNLNVTPSAAYEVTMSYIKCFYNGRQGLSWTGGNGLFVSYSEFSLTGRGKNASSPGSGLDIESEISECRNGYFLRCKFEDNIGNGFVSDYHGKATRSILFSTCTFGGMTAPAIWPHNGDITFENCYIYGQILSPAGLSAAESVRLNNCSLYDYHPSNFSKAYTKNFLIDAGGKQKFYQITNSRIFLRNSKLCYLESGTTNETEMPRFVNNKVYYRNATFTNNDFVALFRGCYIENNEFNAGIQEIPSGGLYLLTGHGSKLKGSNRITGNNTRIGWNSPGGPKVIDNP